MPELVVTNHGAQPVLLLEGETLVGARQNRTLNLSVLLAPGEATVIPVTCVERGRWGAPEATRRSPRLSPVGLRSVKTFGVVACMAAGFGRRSDQQAVWQGVDTYADSHGVSSATDSLEAVHEARADDVARLVGSLRPAERQQGVLVGIGGRAVCLDLFDKPSTLAIYWGALLAGYALDALDALDRATAKADAKAFLARLAATPQHRTPATGLGVELHFDEDGMTGVGIEWVDRLVHLAAFAGGTPRTLRHPGR